MPSLERGLTIVNYWRLAATDYPSARTRMASGEGDGFPSSPVWTKRLRILVAAFTSAWAACARCGQVNGWRLQCPVHSDAMRFGGHSR